MGNQTIVKYVTQMRREEGVLTERLDTLATDCISIAI